MHNHLSAIISLVSSLCLVFLDIEILFLVFLYSCFIVFLFYCILVFLFLSLVFLYSCFFVFLYSVFLFSLFLSHECLSISKTVSFQMITAVRQRLSFFFSLSFMFLKSRMPVNQRNGLVSNDYGCSPEIIGLLNKIAWQSFAIYHFLIWGANTKPHSIS